MATSPFAPNGSQFRRFLSWLLPSQLSPSSTSAFPSKWEQSARALLKASQGEMECVVIPVITNMLHHICKMFSKKVLPYLLFYLTLIFFLQAKYSFTTLFNGLRLYWHKIWSQHILPWVSLLQGTPSCWEEREQHLKLESLAPSKSWPCHLLALGLNLCHSFSLRPFPPVWSRSSAPRR